VLATGTRRRPSSPRFLTGFFLAGVYPPAMKMAATWFRASRGLAIGVIVGALTVGKALPYLIGAFAAARLPVRRAVHVRRRAARRRCSSRRLPRRAVPVPAAPFDWGLVGTILRHRETRLAIGGYLGHMWELYAMWAALSIFFLEFFPAKGRPPRQSLPCSPASSPSRDLGRRPRLGRGRRVGRPAGPRERRRRRHGRERRVRAHHRLARRGAGVARRNLALVWGFAVVADSAQFSALVTEVAPPHAVGTALTLQTSLGFLLTAGTIWLTSQVQRAFGWGVAFSLLAVGPAFGIGQMLRLNMWLRG
jgi:hypothetical protein